MVSLMVTAVSALRFVFRASKRAFVPPVGTLEACVDSRQMVYG